MFVDISSDSSLIYLKTLLISIIIMLTVSPLLSIMSKGDTSWLAFALTFWMLGSIIVFYPFMEHVLPYMLTKTGFFLLTAVLIIISTWFNMTLIVFFLPAKYIYHTLVNITLDQLSLFFTLYLILVSSLILKLNFSYPTKDNS